MSTRGRDFAAMLDELLAEHAAEPERTPPSSLDYLAVVEELHSGRIKVAGKAAEADYREACQGEARKDTTAARRAEPLPSIEPDAIARELGLKGLRARLPKNYDRLRREFARRNHPDRVAEHLKAHALIRMQIANSLIDEAKLPKHRPGRRGR